MLADLDGTTPHHMARFFDDYREIARDHQIQSRINRVGLLQYSAKERALIGANQAMDDLENCENVFQNSCDEPDILSVYRIAQ